jgi:maltose alpha-D-glucosyltransferase/alpha-amylase
MGDNIYLGDRNGVRTPMQWNDDRNAGFSRVNPHQLYLPVIIDPEYRYEVINVQSQQSNLHSFLWWMKRLISLRRRFISFGRGETRFLRPGNHRILAFIRSYQDERILVAANLSRFVQYVELDLSELQGATPIDIFGRTEFPTVGASPFPLTLSPHAFYWFILASAKTATEGETRVSATPVELAADGKWESFFSEKKRDRLEAVIAAYLPGRRWFGGKARRVKAMSVTESIPFHQEGFHAYILFISVDYIDGSSETYVLPVAYAAGPKAESLLNTEPQTVLARVRTAGGDAEGVLYDPTTDKDFGKALLSGLSRRSRWKGTAGELSAAPTPAFRNIVSDRSLALEPFPLKGEQSNTSVVFGESLILKLFRRLQPGVNPDLEIGRYLTLKGFAHVPPVAGALEYKSGGNEPTTLAILQGFVPNRGDAWSYTLGFLNSYLEMVVAHRAGRSEPAAPDRGFIHLASEEPPEEVLEAFGHYAESARLLGRRTAELHRVLAAPGEGNLPFTPEPFSKLYQRSLYQSMRTLTGKNFLLLRQQLASLPEEVRDEAGKILSLEEEILARFHTIVDLKITAMRLRCHGDYHLGQVLHTERDFMIIDFEGEPARPITERKIKRSPLRDVAGMLRSFHYVIYSAVLGLAERGLVRAEEIPEFEPWVEFWHRWAGAIFLSGYLGTCKGAGFLPETEKELEVLLDVFLLEKAVYELGYELNNRPDWVRIPIKGIYGLLRPAG